MIEILAVAGFILHFGDQNEFAPERGGTRNPGTFREHANYFAVRMLRDHADELAAIFFGHPITRFDLFAARDAGLKIGKLLGIFVQLNGNLLNICSAMKKAMAVPQ